MSDRGEELRPLSAEERQRKGASKLYKCKSSYMLG